jgi:hypothetical protein
MTPQMDWTRAVIKVGDGRGFVVAPDRERFVITAAHCLPHFPPCMSFSGIEERTYPKLLGPIGGERTVWAECVFVDPIADVAALGSPDNQEFDKEAKAYDALVEPAIPLPIGDLPLARSPMALSTGDTILGRASAECQAWLLSLDLRWFRCTIKGFRTALWIEGAAEDIAGGMSGSPIVSDAGAAIGLVCMSAGGPGGDHREGGPSPFLSRQLPRWLAEEIATRL